MSSKPSPTFVPNASQVKKTTKKTRFTVTPKKINVWKRLDVADNGNKYRYVRFKFVCPSFNDANQIIESLYSEKVIDWSYVSAQEIRIADEEGGKDFISVHGILRVENYTTYDWKWFRGRWPHAFFKFGYYPENSYPKMQVASEVTIETQKVGAPLPSYSDPQTGLARSVTIDAEDSV